MTKADLIKELEKYPDDMEIYIRINDVHGDIMREAEPLENIDKAIYDYSRDEINPKRKRKTQKEIILFN